MEAGAEMLTHHQVHGYPSRHYGQLTCSSYQTSE